MKECKQCDYDNPVRKGRGHWCCPNCDRDYSLEYLLLKTKEGKKY